MAHKSKKVNKSILIEKKIKKRLTYAEIASARIEEKIKLDDHNRLALKIFEKEKSKKTFWATLKVIKLKYETLVKTFTSDECMEKLGEVKKYHKIFMEQLQIMYQAYILQMVAKIEQAEILIEFGMIQDAIRCYIYTIEQIKLKIVPHFQDLENNQNDNILKEVMQLQLICVYGLCKIKMGFNCDFDNSLDYLRRCLLVYENYPKLKQEKMELFHRTEDFGDLWSKIVNAKRKTEKAIASRQFRFKQNSNRIFAIARKAFN